MEEILKQINRTRIITLISLIACIVFGCFLAYVVMDEHGEEPFFMVLLVLALVIYYHAKLYKDYATKKARPLLIQRFSDIKFKDEGLNINELEGSGVLEKKKRYLGAEEKRVSENSMAFDHDSVKLQTSYVRGIPPSTQRRMRMFAGNVYVYKLPVSVKGKHVLKESYSGTKNKKLIINDEWMKYTFNIETTNNGEFNRMFNPDAVKLFKEIHTSIYSSRTYSFKGRKLYIAMEGGKTDYGITLLQSLEKSYFKNFKQDIDKTKEVMEKLKAMSYHFNC